MGLLESDFRKIELEIKHFNKELEDMHRKVRMYLIDKSKYPRPDYEELILKILNYNYEINGVRDRIIEILLDNLKYKASHRAKIWKRWFAEDARRYSVKRGDVGSNDKFHQDFWR